MAKIELKPCPFCGRAAVMCGRRETEYFNGEWAEKDEEVFWVTCFHDITCLLGSVYARAYGALDGLKYTSEKAAAAAWNERAEHESDST